LGLSFHSAGVALEAKRHLHIAKARLPDAVDVLVRGNHEVLRDFTDEEAALLIALLTRLIANLDRVAGVEASPGTPISEKETDRKVRWRAD
jgi:hypothetical protein